MDRETSKIGSPPIGSRWADTDGNIFLVRRINEEMEVVGYDLYHRGGCFLAQGHAFLEAFTSLLPDNSKTTLQVRLLPVTRSTRLETGGYLVHLWTGLIYVLHEEEKDFFRANTYSVHRLWETNRQCVVEKHTLYDGSYHYLPPGTPIRSVTETVSVAAACIQHPEQLEMDGW